MRLLFAILLAFSLGGCGTTFQVKTPKEAVAACYLTVKVAWDTALDMQARGILKPETKAKILTDGDRALAGCDAARVAVGSGDLKTAEGALKAVEVILISLEGFSKGAK